MSDPVFGISIRRIPEEARPVLAADLSTIGLIGHASEADPYYFPLNEPVLVHSYDTELLKKLGTAGYLPDAIRGINDQLGETEFAARIVLVRTTEGVGIPEVLSHGSVTITGGTAIPGTNKVSQVTVDSVTLMVDPVDWATSNDATAAAVAFEINDNTGTHGFTAAALGAVVTITAAVGTGDGPNGDVVGKTVAGDVTATVTNMTGGVDAVPSLKLQQTINNIVGNSLLGTGIFSFLKAPAKVAFTPRIIMAPGYTGQMANTVGPIIRDNGGYGYIEDRSYNITFTGGGSTAVQAIGHAFGRSDGTLGPVELDLPGAWYTSTPAVTADPPDNPEVEPEDYITATFHTSVVEGANPVCASLTSVLNQLLGHAIVESSGTSQGNDDDWRETFQSERLIPLSGGCRVLDPDLGFIVIRPLAPRMAGIMVRRDHETGAPFHSAANQPVQGIISPNREIGFTITDGENEGPGTSFA